MDTITTHEMVTMLHRFINREFEIIQFGSGKWGEHLFISYDGSLITLIGYQTTVTNETTFLMKYSNCMWRVWSWNSLNHPNHNKLAVRLVEELSIMNKLKDIIDDNCINDIRECQYCHKLINEGWIYQGVNAYCSDECLLADNVDVDINEIKSIANEGNSDTFWTKWET